MYNENEPELRVIINAFYTKDEGLRDAIELFGYDFTKAVARDNDLKRARELVRASLLLKEGVKEDEKKDINGG